MDQAVRGHIGLCARCEDAVARAGGFARAGGKARDVLDRGVARTWVNSKRLFAVFRLALRPGVPRLKSMVRESCWAVGAQGLETWR